MKHPSTRPSLLVALGIVAGAVAFEQEARAACANPPVIGCPDCSPPVEGVLELETGRITINYHDQCSGEDSTRVFARTGLSGSFTQIKQDPANSGGWRTAAHSDLQPNTTYCFMVQTTDDGITKSSTQRCVTTPAARCGPPVIGWEEGGFAPFLDVKPHSITVQYHDQCTAEDWTRVYARPGYSGPWQEIEYDGYNSGNWRTTVHEPLNPNVNYCFRAETSVDGYRQSSTVRCRTTPQPACPPPVIGWQDGGFEPFPEVTPDSIQVQYHDQCGSDKATTIFARPSGSSSWTAIHSESGPKSDWRKVTHSNLAANTRHCFIAATKGPDDYVSYSAEVCTETALAFTNTILSRTESNAVLTQFDWRRTRPVPTGPADAPYLYYANILLEHDDDSRALRTFGIHTDPSPVFVQELNGYTDNSTIVFDDDALPAGRWYFAAIPGEVYNVLRADSITALDRGDDATIPAIVMRRVPTIPARSGGNPYRLDHVHLTELGFEYNAMPSQVCWETDLGQVCQTRQELLGFLARKLVTFSYEAFDFVAEATRDLFGSAARRLEGEIALDVTFVLQNTDEAFMTEDGSGNRVNTRMMSGWKKQALNLEFTTVRVRQGFTSFRSYTNSQGRAIIPIAKDNYTTICFELDNDFVKITQHVASKDLCVQTYPNGFSQDTTLTITVKDPRANAYAQVIDTAKYVQQVFGHTPAKMTMLIGDGADRIAVGGAAFAGCMGRIPNFAISGGAELLGAVLNPVIGATVTSLDYLYSVDIVLPPEHEASRGVTTHEYGHAVMCSMLGAGHLQTAWTQVILQSATHAPNDEASYIAEAFADFVTSQVAGGTNYFAVDDYAPSRLINYADRDGAGLEGNYDDADLTGVGGAYQAKVRRVASLLHDLFDGQTDSNQPNDGRHWDVDPNGYLVLETGNATAVPDEDVALDGRCMPRVFARWRDQAWLLSEDTFLRALAQTAIADGYTLTEVCDVFELHSPTGTCPSYVAGLSTVSGSDPCVDTSGGGGGGGSGDPELPPTQQN